MYTNDTNNTNKEGKLIYPELSYSLVGICFAVHNELGRFAREKQYGDTIEAKLKEDSVSYKREFKIGESNNTLDFLIENKIILEIKAKRIVGKDDYYQLQRYLQASGIKLGLLVNFRERYMHIKRIVRIDTDHKTKFVSYSYH